MEAVLLSTVATQAVLYALNLRAARPPPQPTTASSAAASRSIPASSRAPMPNAVPAVEPAPEAEAGPPREATGVSDGGNKVRREVATTDTPRESADEEVDLTATIESLEAEIKELRAQATYSADTLVSASRADRKANELEAKLKSLRATQPRDTGADLLAVMRRFGGAAASSGPTPLTAGVSSKRDAMRVRFVGFLILYLYFRRRGDRTVVELPCDALWPLAWPLATRLVSQTSADGFCPAGGAACFADTCAVSYYAFSLLAGGFVQLAIAALVARRKRDP